MKVSTGLEWFAWSTTWLAFAFGVYAVVLSIMGPVPYYNSIIGRLQRGIDGAAAQQPVTKYTYQREKQMVYLRQMIKLVNETPIASLLHLFMAGWYFILAPTQFLPIVRKRCPAMHRWAGRCALPAFFVGTLASFFMMPLMPTISAAATLIFGMYASACSIMAYVSIFLRRNVALHREWALRTYAVGFAVLSMRVLYIPVYFPLMTFLGVPTLPVNEAQHEMGLAFWLMWTTHTMLMEVYINCTRSVGKPKKVA